MVCLVGWLVGWFVAFCLVAWFVEERKVGRKGSEETIQQDREGGKERGGGREQASKGVSNQTPTLPQKLQVYFECCWISIFLTCLRREAP